MVRKRLTKKQIFRIVSGVVIASRRLQTSRLWFLVGWQDSLLALNALAVVRPHLAGIPTPQYDGKITNEPLTHATRPGRCHFGHTVETEMPPKSQLL